MLNLGLADQESTRKKSEGQRDSTIELARAESRALETISRVISAQNCSQSEYMIAQRCVAASLAPSFPPSLAPSLSANQPRRR